MLDNPEIASDTLEFLKGRDFKTVYIYADRYDGRNILKNSPDKYRSLIKTFHEARLDVYALLGSKDLHTETYFQPKKREEAENMLLRVLVYNRNTNHKAQFDGINIDIEPYITDKWDQEPERVARQYLDLSRRYMELKKEYNFNGAIGVAIPFWYDHRQVNWNNDTRTLNKHVQDLYDYVTLMDYRDKAFGRDGIVRHAKKEIIYGDKINKTVVIGLETKQNRISKLTFHDDTLKELLWAMKGTFLEFKTYRSFGGFAIHHYGSYREWIKGQEQPHPVE